MSKKILMPLPSTDFDPTESAVPWKYLTSQGHTFVIVTPDSKPATCDPIMLTGKGLGPLAPILSASDEARQAYREFSRSPEFLNPKKWDEVKESDFDALLLPGGHAPGMKEYLESDVLHKLCVDFFKKGKAVAALCHGVVLAARSHAPGEKSILHGRKVTSLLFSQEMTAWFLTFSWLGNYYRTYRLSVEEEVRSKLEKKSDFLKGPAPLLRDSPEHMNRGFCVQDRNLLTARWPGDVYNFSEALNKFLFQEH